MSKLKTNRTAAKCFRKIGTDKLVCNKAYETHILIKKSIKRKRNLRKDIVTDVINLKVVKKILPYLQV